MRSVELQGHRGARGLLPENTIPGFERAIEIGVDAIELDCAVTKDRVVAVTHDSVLNPEITRDASGRWLPRPGPPVWHLDFAELARYDVGRIDPASEYARRFPHQKPVDGARIPRLADVFARAKRAGDEKLRLNLEIKTSPLEPGTTADPAAFVETLLGEVRGAALEDRVGLLSFDWRTLDAARRGGTTAALVCVTAEQPWMDNVGRAQGASPWTAPHHVTAHGGSVPRMVHAAGGTVWSSYFGDVTRESVDEAHALGLEVVVWTVNEEADMRRMIALGVDSLVSDYPDRLVRVARALD